MLDGLSEVGGHLLWPNQDSVHICIKTLIFHKDIEHEQHLYAWEEKVLSIRWSGVQTDYAHFSFIKTVVARGGKNPL